MKPWSDLTDVGKARRLRPLVADVLGHYGLSGSRIRLFEVATNVVFRIDSQDASYVLKIDVEDDFTEQHVNIALDWLNALNADTDIPVVELVPTHDGRNYVYADTEGVPPRRRCTLYRWVKGSCLFDVPTRKTYFELGALTARLHEHAAGFTPLADPIRWDKVLYFPGEELIVHNPDYSHRISKRMRDLFDECSAVVSPILASLYDTPARLIHADLHGWNINVYRGHLTILDFDDVMLGQPVHDIAITYGYRRDDDEYPDWIEGYEEGYRSVSPWPVEDPGHIDALMVARRLMFTNYVLTFPDDISEYLTSWEKHFSTYLAG